MPDNWTVPGYTHVRDLSADASGRVVLAVDDVTETPVAIKYMRGDAVLLRRIQAEAHALSRIEDPNLVQVYEYAAAPGQSGEAAVVTEFVDGVSLRRLLEAEGGVTPEAALSVLSGSLLALAALHDDAGIAHRAYRPENVLIATDGTTKLSDAGIGDAAAYQAPEQRAGPLADLYAATAVFVECLTGAHAVPGPFHDLIAAGLSPDPAARPPSAADYLTELDEIAATAYGSAWERTGRGRLAEHAARAAAYVPPAQETAAPEPAVPEPAVPEPVAPAPAAPEPVGEDWAPLADLTDLTDGPFDAVPAEAAAADSPPDSVPAASSASPAEAATAPVERSSATRMSPFGPPPYGDRPEQPLSAPAGRARPALPRQWAARVRLALAVGAVVIVAAGTTWYVVSSRNSHDPVASAQAGSPASTGPSGAPARRPPADATGLARTISRTVGSRRTATFIYRAPGVAAQGALKHNGGAPAAYDMRVTPLIGGRPDQGRPVSRVILFGGNAYVARGGWKPYPAAGAGTGAGGGIPAGDPGRRYATLAADIRQSSSAANILALLGASTRLQRTGLTYRGVADLSRLTQERTVADLYRRAPRGALVTYTIEMAQNLLPRRLTVTITTPGARRAFRTTYTGWGQRVAITPPR